MRAPQTSIAAAQAALAGFTRSCAPDHVERYGDGLINATFLVSAGGSRYVLQRINDSVFPEPEKIMSNLALLQRYLAPRTDSRLRIPGLLAAWNGLPYVRDAGGGIWRLMDYIPNTVVLPRVDSLEQAREVGRILGRFHVLASDLPVERLATTLPGFHESPRYLERFLQVLAERGKARGKELTASVAFVAARREHVGVLEEARQQGRIPTRVIHGDPKLDNILFDRETDRAVSLIDLDTVQPGLIHYDLADCLRSCCNRKGESADQTASFDLDICRAILPAYAAEARDLLRQAEIDLLPHAIRLLPLELGLRFLTDYLEGNRYFRVTEPGQNLRKANIQFALVANIEAKERAIRDIVAASFGQGGRQS